MAKKASDDTAKPSKDHKAAGRKRESVFWRQSPKYQDNAKTADDSIKATPSKKVGPVAFGFHDGGKKDWQAHHILCEHAVMGREIPGDADYVQYVEECLWITPWNLNQDDNMVGMPTNWQYVKSLGQTPENIPSHQVDHNTSGGYTEECLKHLTKKVFNKLQAKRSDHDVDAEALADHLVKASEHFRKILAKRGRRKGGTKLCWARRFPGRPLGHEPEWYYPFSMGAEPSERSPGIDWNSLEDIFKKLNPR